MREIKFRAWFPINHWCREGMIDDWECDMAVETLSLVPDEEGVHIMQFTGLHDKNGKDIYEGDIVTRKYESGVFETCEIKFMDGSFCGWFEDEPDAYFNIGGDNHRHTVIGNIHENPELLESQS